MKISSKCRYGTRLMIDIAAHCSKGFVLLGDIARRQNISEKYLWNLAAPLKAAGFITAQRGVKGGYTMARDPDTITVKDIIVVLEGPIDLVECRDCNNNCCVTNVLWEKASDDLNLLFGSYKLSDLAKKEAQLRFKEENQGDSSAGSGI